MVFWYWVSKEARFFPYMLCVFMQNFDEGEEWNVRVRSLNTQIDVDYRSE